MSIDQSQPIHCYLASKSRHSAKRPNANQISQKFEMPATLKTIKDFSVDEAEIETPFLDGSLSASKTFA